MLFLAGPRQVGKTTVSFMAKDTATYFHYLNWDNGDDQKIILEGPAAIATVLGLNTLREGSTLTVFDELHKYSEWKNFLKGFYDVYGKDSQVLVTGSAKLDIYRRGQDSLMGRYFLYRVHPFSIGECLRTTLHGNEIHFPEEIAMDTFDSLLQLGGFPDPFLKQNANFARRWRRLWHEQLFREDIRDAKNIQSMSAMLLLASLLKHQVGQRVNYSQLAKKVKVAAQTIVHWITLFNEFYFCFLIKPWSQNVSRSLLKQPKLYLWDWSEVPDPNQKIENFVASHLLKAVHLWTDEGLGEYELCFLRDKEQREVDFLVLKNNQPWFLVEVKQSSNSSISKWLYHYQKKLKVSHAFQVVFDLPYVDKDCFAYKTPMIVPVQTLLSQLV